MDGVVTRTATIHAEAWKQLFDRYLKKRAARGGGRYRPVKSVAVPLRILGRRWGNLEFAYLD